MLTAQTWGIKAWQESDTSKISSLGAKRVGGGAGAALWWGGREIT